MTRTLFATLAVTTVLAGAALAVPPQLGADVGTDLDAVRAALTAEGYEILELELDDGLIEVELLSADGQFEVEIDPSSGQIVSVELEDQDDDDDEDDDDDA